MKLQDILNGKADAVGQNSSTPLVHLGYARVSTDDQDRMGLSIPAQCKDIERYASDNGILLDEMYLEAESAFSDESNRPEFMKMVARALTDPRISGIIVHDSSRFFRDPHAGPMIRGQLQAAGVRIVSVTEPEYDPQTTSGLAIEKMTEFKNAAYSMDIRFHTRKGMRENIARRDPEIGFCYKNGGAAPWGFKSYRVQRGSNSRGAAIMKTLWDKNDEVIAGKPVSEWAYHMLVKLRLEQHLSYDAIRDFLNDKGIPSPRKKYWSVSSIRSLLQPSALLKFAGYGVWNVHGKKGKLHPPSEWVTVEDAHPAIISLEQAEAIMEVNQKQRQLSGDKSKKRMAAVRSEGSKYILSGGLFVCKRCGANMVGYRNHNRLYYVCGAFYYRKGLGCGAAFQVKKEDIESATIAEIEHLFTSLTDPSRLAKIMDKELQTQQARVSSDSSEISSELDIIESEIANVRKAIKNGLEDVAWANEEIRNLNRRREELQTRQTEISLKPEPSKIDKTLVERCKKDFAKVLACGSPAEKKAFIRLFLKQIELDPDTGDILMHLYSRPAGLKAHKKSTPASLETGVPIGVVAGTGFEPATFGL